jgi:hypothetical protein
VSRSHLALTCGNGGCAGCWSRVQRAGATALCAGCARLALGRAAGICLEGGGAEGFEAGEQLAEPPVVVDPGLVVVLLVRAEPAADGARCDLAGPLPVGAVQPGRVAVAGAAVPAAAGVPLGDGAGQHHAGGGDGGHLGGDLAGLGLVAGGDTHGLRVAQFPRSGHVLLYMYSMNAGEVAGYIAGWGPPSVSPAGADFARSVVAACGPAGRERAKNLLWAAGKLADYGTGLGLEPVPLVLLHPSVIERPGSRRIRPA